MLLDTETECALSTGHAIYMLVIIRNERQTEIKDKKSGFFFLPQHLGGIRFDSRLKTDVHQINNAKTPQTPEFITGPDTDKINMRHHKTVPTPEMQTWKDV